MQISMNPQHDSNSSGLPMAGLPSTGHDLSLPVAPTPQAQPLSVPSGPPPMPVSDSPAVTQAAQPAAGSYASPDTDVDDTEWVKQVKGIVERTKDDPYAQAAEIEKIRAAYLKTRFDRDIKTGGTT